MKKLHHRIRESRKRLGLSQTELASRCQVSQPTIANWERAGHIPRRAALEKIAECLEVDPLWLLSGETAIRKSIVNTYLSTPIHHIPIYEFKYEENAFKEATPLKFISLSISQGDLFGLEVTEETDSFESKIYVFNRDIETAPYQGDYLTQQNDRLDIVAAKHIDMRTAKPIAKLCLTMTCHESPQDQT